MKRELIIKINNLVLNYMSVIGISGYKEDVMDDDNPIFSYFYKYIFTNKKIKLDNIKIDEINISRSIFYDIINESYRVYLKLDNIILNQHESTRNILINIVGQEELYDNMIEQILNQYKDSFFDVLYSYNGKNENFLNIKISILTEKMISYGLKDDFDNAILIQNKIKKLKKLSNKKGDI